MSDSQLASTANTAPAQVTRTHGEVFLEKVQSQFVAQMGEPTAWTPLEKALAQHLFVMIDLSLREQEIKRASDDRKANNPPITWANVNMLDLANNAAKIVRWQLDAELPNHVSAIAQLNGRTNKYEIRLSPGYEGIRHLHTKFSLNPPLKVTFHLVHDDDTFDIDESLGWPRPEFKRGNYFKPGEVIGGFGHIQYENPRMNIVAPVEYREFEKARKASKNVDFWGGQKDEWTSEWVNGKRVSKKTGRQVEVEGFTKEMMYKTVVLRVCKKHLPLDPAKINLAELYAFTEADADEIEADFREEVEANANKEAMALDAPASTVQVDTVQITAPTADEEFPD